MGQASHIQGENKWALEETIRQAQQKFTTDLKTIATETTNDEKLLKSLACLEKRTLEQLPDEYKPHHKQLSTRFDVVFYDERINTKITENNNNHASTQRTCGNQQNDNGGKTILVATIDTKNTTKMRRMYSVQNGR